MFLRQCSALLTPYDLEIIDTGSYGHAAISLIRKICHRLTHLLPCQEILNRQICITNINCLFVMASEFLVFRTGWSN